MSKERLDNLLRPKEFKDFVGQKPLVEDLLTYTSAAKERNESLDHCLLSGPPGLGKTTLAYLIASLMGSNITSTSGPMLRKPVDIALLLRKLKQGDVLFIDEIHGIPRVIEEYLYSAMEDFFIDLVLDKGPEAKPIRYELPRFSLLGATTREGDLSRPFRDRFGIQERLEFYSSDELSQILSRSSNLLEIELDNDSKAMIAKSARGTPRVANRILKRIRDMVQMNGRARIDSAKVGKGLKRLGVDASGLDKTDRKILKTLADAGSFLGVRTLASMCDLDVTTLEESHEPFLLKNQLIFKASRGRNLTKKGLDFLIKSGECND